MQNPFDPYFSMIPKIFIDYQKIANKIVHNVETVQNHAAPIYITGVRGSGKTVLLTHIRNLIENQTNTVIANTVLNPDENLIENIIVQILNNPKFKLGLTFKLPFIDIQVSENEQNEQLTQIITKITKQHKRVVIFIDEARNSRQLRRLASLYSIWRQNNLPVSIVMAGLPDQIIRMKSYHNMTFLLRSDSYLLSPLTPSSISQAYQKYLNIDPKFAEKLTIQTQGYAYAFQLLGSLIWNAQQNGTFKHSFEAIQDEFIETLSTHAYQEIMKNLTDQQQEFMKQIQQQHGVIADITKAMDIDRRQTSALKKIMRLNGLIKPVGRFKAKYTLPYFDQFLENDQSLDFSYSW